VDFAAVAGRIEEFLDERGYRWALIGGVALAAYGLARTTLDLDLVTEARARDALIGFLEAAGYETLHRSAGYSNHLHARAELGRVDVVYVDPATAAKLFAGARRLAGPGGRELPVPAPEHLAAMKVFAIRNDPSRELQDLADLRFLLTLPGVDRAAVRDSFERHGLADRYEALVAGL
jgi:hypothetical protein